MHQRQPGISMHRRGGHGHRSEESCVRTRAPIQATIPLPRVCGMPAEPHAPIRATVPSARVSRRRGRTPCTRPTAVPPMSPPPQHGAAARRQDPMHRDNHGTPAGTRTPRRQRAPSRPERQRDDRATMRHERDAALPSTAVGGHGPTPSRPPRPISKTHADCSRAWQRDDHETRSNPDRSVRHRQIPEVQEQSHPSSCPDSARPAIPGRP
jgi:hypothetical protein